MHEGANNQGGEEFEARIGDKSIRLRGRDPLTILFTLVVLAGAASTALMIYMLHEHKGDARDAMGLFIGAIKEQTVVTKQLVSAQVEQNCLVTAKVEERAARAEECRRLARMANP